ncbi:hypothetical protein BGZ83_009334 [Gryganskiella cystojenkinii]|nr:hypothetical protein BGZ83_009334 [Gryganskiella cystojenkinii]
MMVRVVLLSVLVALNFVLQQVSAEQYRIWSSFRGTWARTYYKGVPEVNVVLNRDIADSRDNEIWEIEFDCVSRIVNKGTGQPAHQSSQDSFTIVTASYFVEPEWQVSRVRIENGEDMYRIALDGTNLVWTQVRGSITLWELDNDEVDWDQLWRLEPIRSDSLLERFKGQ